MPRPVHRKLQSRLKFLRGRQGLTQEALAREWSVSTTTVQNWEKKPDPVIELVRLCEVLCCSPRDLVIAPESSSRSSRETLEKLRQSIKSKPPKSKSPKSPPLETRIAELRDAQGLTQKQLASAIDVCLTTIQSWEHGRANTGNLIKFIILCEILSCKHTELLGFTPSEIRTETKDLSEIRQRLKPSSSNKTNLELCSKPSNKLEAIEEK